MGKQVTKTKYSSEDLEKVLRLVKNGVSKKSAARHCGVLRSTIIFKLNKSTPLKRRGGKPAILNTYDEKQLVSYMYITFMANAGDPVTSSRFYKAIEISLISKRYYKNITFVFKVH